MEKRDCVFYGHVNAFWNSQKNNQHIFPRIGYHVLEIILWKIYSFPKYEIKNTRSKVGSHYINILL